MSVYVLDNERLAGHLVEAIGLRADYAAVSTLYQTWRIGYQRVAAGAAFPVFLSIQWAVGQESKGSISKLGPVPV